MRPLSNKSQSTLHSALTVTLLLLSAAAILFYYICPPVQEDAMLDGLVRAVIPRFFIAIFLLVLAMEYFPACLLSGRVGKNLLWCILPLLVALVNFPFSSLIRGIAHITRADLLGLFLFKCLLIGLGEEVLFRGIVFDSLMQAFKKKNDALFWSVLLSSAVFALFHFINLLDGADILSVLQQVGYSFLIGAMLAVVLQQTKNLWLCVALHALFDTGGMIVSDLGVGDPQDLIFWILTIIVGVGCAVQIVFMLVKQQKKLLG